MNALFNNEGMVLNFQNQMVTKQQVIEKLKAEMSDCKKRVQNKLWFFYHYGLGQMQMIDTNADFRATRYLYKAQGFDFKGNFPVSGFTAEEIGARKITYNVYAHYDPTKGDGTDPMSTLCGYMNAGHEMVIYEVDVQ